jgi:FAD:protein FMN transferase
MQLIFKDFKRFSKLAVGLLFLWNCSSEQPTSQQLQGYALGTSYSLTYVSATLSKEDLTVEIDSLFQALNQSLSTYIPDSSISKINAGDSLFTKKPPKFGNDLLGILIPLLELS